MVDFSAAIEAQLTGKVVRVAQMAQFDFVSETMRVWPGFGDLVAGGETWRGTGGLGSISSITKGTGGTADEVSFSLSGVDASVLAHLESDIEEAAGQRVRVFLQFFQIDRVDDFGNVIDWQTLADPIVVWRGVMGPLSVQRPRGNPDGSGGASRVISVSARNGFVTRSRPALAYYSDRDQKARSPGDNLLINMATFADATIRWPDF